jgi:translation initiation factor eIF-2B subunit gamma
LGVWYDTRTPTPIKGEETDFIAVAPLPSGHTPPPKDSLLSHVSQLVYSIPTDSLKDLTEEKSAFPIRHGLLRRHANVRMLTSHRDAHIYFLPHWIMAFVAENKRLESIGEDVIGWWVKAGWQPGLAERLRLGGVLRPSASREEGAFSRHDDESASASSAGAGARAPQSIAALSAPAAATDADEGDDGGGGAGPDDPDETANQQRPVPRMLAYIHPSGPAAPLIRRVDTAQLLLATSLQLAKLPSIEEVGSSEAASPFAHARKVAYPEGVKPRTTITKADSLVADNVTVEEKVSIRESVVGANCQIREGAKLLQCLLMDGVVVGKNVKLTRCILGRRSEVGEGSVLTDCEVQENLLVEPKSKSGPFLFLPSFFVFWVGHLFPTRCFPSSGE